MAADTPVITKKQEKNTLSGKKKKPEVIKNVLAQPYQNYWPKLPLEDNVHLTETLMKCLPRLQVSKVNVPYQQIKNIPKEERKNFRRTFHKDASNEASKPEERNLFFGVNDATKLIERREAGAVLISSDVQPRLLVLHVIDQAVLNNVPVLVVDDLRTLCKEKCGISGAVISLKKTVAPDSELGAIIQTVRDISDNCRKPRNHINFNRSLNVSTITINDSEDGRSFRENADEDIVESKDYHLKKRKGKKRAFVPEDAPPEGIIDFINLDCSDTVSELPAKAIRSREKTQYHPLKVKRLRGNKNRNKRKIKRVVKKNN